MLNNREYLLDYDNWGAILFINSYVVYIGYVSMAIKGMGFLVLTWTTVVLLGGFVSMLQRKDFWSLTFITLVQTAGIFDVALNEKLSYLYQSIFFASRGIRLAMMGNLKSKLLFMVVVLAQMILYTLVLCPLVLIYMLGILLSGVISLWRLIERDYGGNSDGEASNLAPAMDALYYLALLQSVLFLYRLILHRGVNKLAMEVVKGKPSELEFQVVSTYLRETRIGCEKDPSFVKGRNLITYAIDKICSNSPSDCIVGVQTLYTTICLAERETPDRLRDIRTGKSIAMKHMICSALSSRRIIQKLLETLDSASLHDRETRIQAAKVVESLAFKINLVEFPQGTKQISSLIGTFEEYSVAKPYERDGLFEIYEQDWNVHARQLLPSPDELYKYNKLRKGYMELLLQGMCIFRKLAADETNCRVINDTTDLVSKIMAPITSDLLDHTTIDCGAWLKVVEKSMEVMSQLANAPGETGANLRHQIASCEEAVSTLQGILRCLDCNEELQKRAIQILTRLYMDNAESDISSRRLYMDNTESNRSSDFVILGKESNRAKFVRKLVEIFITDKVKYSNSIRGYAGGALSKIISHGGINDATAAIQTTGNFVKSLSEVLSHDETETCRQAAAEILEHVCTHYTKNDEGLGEHKKTMIKVLCGIFSCADKTHTSEEAGEDGFSKPETDIESQQDNFRGNGISSSSSQPQSRDKQVPGEMLHFGDETQNGKEADQDEFGKPKAAMEDKPDAMEENKFKKEVQSIISKKLQASLLSLFGTLYDRTLDCNVSTFLENIKKVVEENNAHPRVENLLLCKAICKMVISMMENNGSRFTKQEDLESLIEALSTASQNMLDLDYSMVFRCMSSPFAITSSKLDRWTLKSLLNKAKVLLSTPSNSVPTAIKLAEDEAVRFVRQRAECRNVDDFSIKRCISVLNALEEVTQAEKVKAFGVFKHVESREIFLTADPKSALIWLRSEMA